MKLHPEVQSAGQASGAQARHVESASGRHAARQVPGPHGCVEHARQLWLALYVLAAHVKLHPEVKLNGPVGAVQAAQ